VYEPEAPSRGPGTIALSGKYEEHRSERKEMDSVLSILGAALPRDNGYS
jgi:hypothetical protein